MKGEMHDLKELCEEIMQAIYSRKSKTIAWILSLLMIMTCFAFMQTSAAKAATAKAPYTNGTSLKDTVFYIAVDADGDGSVTGTGDAVYYYTLAEIKAAGETENYEFNNHGVKETDSIKGAKLSTLLDNTTGTTWNKDWTIQYMEEDAYHATSATYQDTIQGLTDETGVGNGSGYAGAARTIIGYAGKTTWEPESNGNVSDKNYVNFADYEREASDVRAYRMTASANGSVLKMLKGVVISPDSSKHTGEVGYTIKSLDADGSSIADDYEVMGFVSGMKCNAEPRTGVTWATLNGSQSGSYNGSGKVITIGDDTSQTVAYKYTENPFMKIYQNGKTTTYLRSNIAASASEYPASTKDFRKFIPSVSAWKTYAEPPGSILLAMLVKASSRN